MLEPSHAEWVRRGELLAKLPETERPIALDKSHHNYAVTADRAFGIQTEAMTYDELLAFARRYAQGKVRPNGSYGDARELFLLFTPNIAPGRSVDQDRAEIVKEAVHTRLSAIEMACRKDGSDAAIDEHDIKMIQDAPYLNHEGNTAFLQETKRTIEALPCSEKLRDRLVWEFDFALRRR